MHLSCHLVMPNFVYPQKVMQQTWPLSQLAITFLTGYFYNGAMTMPYLPINLRVVFVGDKLVPNCEKFPLSLITSN